MERRKFAREFKLEAVRLIKDRGVSFAQASKDPECPRVAIAQVGESICG
jgi:transposase